MGIADKLKQLLGFKKPVQAIQSLELSLQSLQSDSIDDWSKRTFQEPREFSQDHSRVPPREAPAAEAMAVGPKGFSEAQTLPPLQKDSFQLGLAAGYTGRSIKEIESALVRIESQMVTRDWFKNEFEDQTPEIAELLKIIRDSIEKHDSDAQKRFDTINTALERLQVKAITMPEPLREDLLKDIDMIRSQIPLSSKMEDLVGIVKSSREISYEELSQRLSITVSALRGLLSNTMKRTGDIDRERRNGKGWVVHKSV